VLKQAREADLLSDEHFSVDGTLIEAWASQKSFQRKDGATRRRPMTRATRRLNFHGEKRSNQTHESTTDPDARLARKSGGHEAKLAYTGNVLIENRNGLGWIRSCCNQPERRSATRRCGWQCGLTATSA
jgi:hypothetical protein